MSQSKLYQSCLPQCHILFIVHPFPHSKGHTLKKGLLTCFDVFSLVFILLEMQVDSSIFKAHPDFNLGFSDGYSSTCSLNWTAVLVTVQMHGRGIELLTEHDPVDPVRKCSRHSAAFNLLPGGSSYSSIHCTAVVFKLM